MVSGLKELEESRHDESVDLSISVKLGNWVIGQSGVITWSLQKRETALSCGLSGGNSGMPIPKSSNYSIMLAEIQNPECR